MTASTLSEPNHASGEEHHPPFLAHHFESSEQQFDSCKLGMWLFLVTEVMFFSGLICAYVVYRANHPEIFVYCHQFLDARLGAVNTVVLLVSSLTMALAVRAAQLGQRWALIVNLVLTLACAGGFLGIKYVEYSHKWHAGLLWASAYKPDLEHMGGTHASAHSADGSADHHQASAGPEAAGHGASDSAHSQAGAAEPRNAGIFFSIYFCLTGVHGIHILAGIIAIVWLLRRSVRGDFSSEYYGPVDFVGLYWHLVDLIWIYLFPLLYLIH